MKMPGPLLRALAMAVLASPALPSLAASFDCNKTTQPIEHLLCDDSALGQLDERVASAYAAAQALSPRSDVAKRRAEQKTWLATRDACLAKAQPGSCVKDAMAARAKALEGASVSERAALDAIVATIPTDPAGAAQRLATYDAPLASAWLAYLHRFEPTSGVSADIAKRRFEQANAALHKRDDFAASILDRVRETADTPTGEAELLMLRMQLEQANANNDEYGNAYCFVFARQGELAYSAFGPLYGSTRDGFGPICAAQGDLFEQPAWQRLNAAFSPVTENLYADAGTIRFATFAEWKVIALRATVSPQLYLAPALAERYAEDPDATIRNWDEANAAWPLAQRKAALELLPQVREATADWLMRQRGMSSALAHAAADRIVAAWVEARLQGT